MPRNRSRTKKSPSLESIKWQTLTKRSKRRPVTFGLLKGHLEPAEGQVLIRVEACGAGHTDAAIVEGQFAGLRFPRVPGHEAAGRIEAVGTGAPQWRVGQRVGVGFRWLRRTL